MRPPASSCSPAGCPTSATCRCGPDAAWPRRCATRARGRGPRRRRRPAARLRDGPAGLRGPAAARRDRRGRRDPRGPRARSASRTSAATPAACRVGVRQAGRQDRRGRGGHPHARVGDACRTRLPRARRGRRDGRDGRAARAAPRRQAGQRGPRSDARGPRRGGPAAARWSAAFAYGDTALVEHFVAGTEVAVPVIESAEGRAPCPRSGSARTAAIYDYTARYTAGSTEFSCRPS